MSDKLERLNRLRVHAGKPELKSWKASQDKLDEAIKKLLDEGHIDVLPGANTNVEPVTTDPEIAKALKPKEDPEEKKATKVNPALGRGLDTDGYARHSRKAVQDHRERERKEAKDERKEKKKKPPAPEPVKKSEAKGKVDPKKDPDKAKRQEQHIADKKAKREAEGKTVVKKEVGKDKITIADLARELNIAPKVARAKLRRATAAAKLEKLHVKGDDAWTFPKSAKADLSKILR